jgi:serine/threonine-protein kinase
LGGEDISLTTLQTRLANALGERYRLEGLLGRGGMGAVFKAHDERLDRTVAVKVLPPELVDGTLVSRFEREARTAAKLDHPGIIPIHHVDHSGDLYYFIMKFVSGRGLDDLVAAGALPVDFCQRVLWESAAALAHAHRRGVIHRDIKPANIMIDEEGRVLITDFGISKAAQDATQITATGQVVGTPNYMSPEQAKGVELDARSDQYSLGLTGYHMLTGELPYGGTSLHALIYKQIYEDLPPILELRPDVPDYVAAAVQRAIAKEPDERFASMEEFATAVLPDQPLRASVGGLPRASADSVPTVTPTPTTPTPTMAEGAGRKRGMVMAAAAVAVLAGGGGWFLLSRDSAAPPSTTETGPVETVVAEPPTALDSAGPAAEAVASDPPPETEPAPVAAATTAPAPARPQPSTPEAEEPPAVRLGSLIINSDPFGTVYVDGVGVGDTPVVNHPLTPGVHIVEVRREGFVTAVDTIDVVPGNTYRRTKILIPRGN